MQGRFVYTVVQSVLEPLGDASVTAPTTDARLTLITANPAFLWRNELVVIATLQGKPVAASSNVATDPVGFEPGLSAGSANVPAALLLWSEVLLGSLACAWILYRRWSPVATYVLTTPVILASMYALFENLARLLPPVQ